VLKGTSVKLTITPTMTTKGGHVVLGEQDTVPLSVNADGTLSGSFTAQHDGFYRIELDSPKGERLTASPQYTVDLLADLAPTVKLSKPGRDTDATPVEEFFIEGAAEGLRIPEHMSRVAELAERYGVEFRGPAPWND
jgi:hypothetical protein